MELLDVGWPDDPVMPDVGARRVYVALATLRKLGLREVLLSQDDGYLFSPELEVTLSDAVSPDTRSG